MQNKLTKHIVRGGVVSAIGVIMLSLDSAAAAGLSPQDRCAIAKLEAASREGACLTDAQIAGIRQGWTDQQVDKQVAACRQKERQSFKNAEDLPGKCETLGDAAAVDYGLKLATDIPRACGESGPPCHADNPATLTTTLLRNEVSRPIRATVKYASIPYFCLRGLQNFNPDLIDPSHAGISGADSCLITRIEAEMVSPRVVCRAYTSSGTGYRTFRVVPEGEHGCVVNRP